MLRVFDDAGFAVSRRLEGGTTEVRARASPRRRPTGTRSTSATTSRSPRRSRRSSRRGRSRSSAPRSRRGSIGGELFRNILDSDFEGIAYPVNPKAPSIAGVKAYPSIADIPDVVDLAVFCVPGDAVLAEAEAALANGARGRSA